MNRLSPSSISRRVLHGVMSPMPRVPPSHGRGERLQRLEAPHLLSEHSPIRQMFKWKWINLLLISVHFVRHKIGIRHFVSTSVRPRAWTVHPCPVSRRSSRVLPVLRRSSSSRASGSAVRRPQNDGWKLYWMKSNGTANPSFTASVPGASTAAAGFKVAATSRPLPIKGAGRLPRHLTIITSGARAPQQSAAAATRCSPTPGRCVIVPASARPHTHDRRVPGEIRRYHIARPPQSTHAANGERHRMFWHAGCRVATARCRWIAAGVVTVNIKPYEPDACSRKRTISRKRQTTAQAAEASAYVCFTSRAADPLNRQPTRRSSV